MSLEPITVEFARDLADDQRQAWTRFAGSACRIDGDKIGFLPWVVYDEAAPQARLIVASVNNDRVGFLLWSRTPRRELRINQIWLRADARLLTYGRAMLDFLDAHVVPHAQVWRLRCWVAQDLAANLFWQAMGFQRITWRHSPAAHKKRPHWLYARATASEATALNRDAAPTNVPGTPERHQAKLLLPAQQPAATRRLERWRP